MSTFLKSIDHRFAKLASAGLLDSAQHAINHGDGAGIHAVLSQSYGALQEVICLTGPHMARCILVFDGGVGLLAGAESYIPILTFGYLGQGSHTLAAFLTAAGFAYTDAPAFQPPLIVCRDGSTIKGVTHGAEIRWEDGTTTPMPKFPGT